MLQCRNEIIIPNFEDKESQIRFKKTSSETNVFTQCFESEDGVLKQCETWISNIESMLKGHLRRLEFIQEKKVFGCRQNDRTKK